MANPPSLPHPPQLPPLDLQNTSEDTSAAFTDQFSTENPAHNLPSSLSPPPTLRKSISVDSFVSPPAFSSPRQRDVQPPPQRSFVAGLANAFRRESSSDLRSSRNRGTSVSSVRDQHQPLDPDPDRQPPADKEQRFRLPSLKGSESSRLALPVRGGELPLPARTPASANDSAVHPSSVSALADGTNTQNSSKRISNAPSNSGRSRSISIGAPTPTAARRIVINTQITNIPTPLVPTVDETVTIVVVGTQGCGKTQAIRKGLSGFNLSDSLPSTTQRAVGGVSIPSYTYRLGTIVRDRSSDCPISVVEIDVAPTDAPILRDQLWPEAVPSIDAVVICYNSAERNSFKPVEPLLRAYHAMRLPIIVLACKADMEAQIKPDHASKLLEPFRIGLVEVTVHNEFGKDKLKRSFDWLLKAVFRHRKAIDTKAQPDNAYLNPASPDVLISPPPWETSRTVTPVVAQSHPTSAQPLLPPLPGPNHYHLDKPAPAAISHASEPVRNETGRIYERHKARLRSAGEAILNDDDGNLQLPSGNEFDDLGRPDAHFETSQQNPVKDEREKSKPAQFATLEELLDKLLFIAVSGDDPTFISSFLLTYRRFCIPRSVLLAMQKKMRQLDEPCGDPMFACFGQMRICHLLEVWIAEYPYDFAVKGTSGALHALIRSIISKTHLLHYGSQLLPFLEILPTLQDQDAAWAFKADLLESDAESLIDDYEDLRIDGSKHSSLDSPISTESELSPPTASANNLRERKPSLPLVKSLGFALNGPTDHSDPSPKQQLRDLLRVANEVMAIDASEIAEEITRVEAKYFLDITSRDWMHFVFPKQRKPDDPIVAFNTIANHLGDWVVSLILCHDRAQKRARQMEKMVDIAGRLRSLNNYSALRAFVAGINNSTFPGDETMELFKSRSPEQAKNLQSWDVLLQQFRAHRAYRLALRNSKGACIPALEVHIADMIKAQEANPDHKEADAAKIHWAKFSMMGRFVAITNQCQSQCRSSTDYNFSERNHIRDLFVKRPVMSIEMQRTRLNDSEFSEYGPSPPSNLPKQDTQAMRRLFFW